MNKYTLTFNSDQLELNYQSSRIQMRKYILVGINLSVIINNLLKLIIDVVLSINNNTWYLQLAVVIVCSIVLVFLNKLKNSFQYYLIVLNYFSIIEYFQLNNTYDLHQAYAKGFNIMTLHILILLVSDFSHSIHQITLNTMIRVFFSFIMDNEWQGQQYQLAFSFVILQIVASYFLNLALRQQFLLKIKEQQIQQFIPIVIQKPFYYFEYKNDMFSLLNSNTQQHTYNHSDMITDYCDGCRFRQMLRSFKFQNQTLESFIIQRINMNSITQYSQQNLEIQTSYKNKQIIQYSELFSDRTQFLIVFNQHVTDLQSFIEIKDYYNKFQSFILNHIKNTYKILQLPQSEIQRNLIRLNLSCTSNLLLKNNTVKSFDAMRILRVLRNIVHKNVKIISLQQEIVINTYKVLFIQAFYQIFEIFNQLEKDINKQLSLAFMTKQTRGQAYLQILISVSQSDAFIRMWRANHVLKQLENILFSEVFPDETFRLLILDLEYAIPYQKSFQRRKAISYNDNDESLLA